MHVLILLNNKQGYFSSYNTTRGYNAKRHIWQQTKNYQLLLYFPLYLESAADKDSACFELIFNSVWYIFFVWPKRNRQCRLHEYIGHEFRFLPQKPLSCGPGAKVSVRCSMTPASPSNFSAKYCFINDSLAYYTSAEVIQLLNISFREGHK